MLEPGPETRVIRKIVDCLSDEDLRTKGPMDLRDAVEKAGFVYDDVRNNVNNELARARRRQGIRKGRGRKVASDFPVEPEHRRLFEIFTELDRFGSQFESWKHAREVIEDVFRFADELGGNGNLIEVVEMKLQDAKNDKDAEDRQQVKRHQ